MAHASPRTSRMRCTTPMTRRIGVIDGRSTCRPAISWVAVTPIFSSVAHPARRSTGKGHSQRARRAMAPSAIAPEPVCPRASALASALGATATLRLSRSSRPLPASQTSVTVRWSESPGEASGHRLAGESGRGEWAVADGEGKRRKPKGPPAFPGPPRGGRRRSTTAPGSSGASRSQRSPSRRRDAFRVGSPSGTPSRGRDIAVRRR